MSLKLMYITNNPQVARIAETVGVDRVFIDMEYIGKDLRQGGMDTVQSRHTIQDIIDVRKEIQSDLLVRCNPIHDETDEYCSSEKEIDDICNAGADIIMLPYFKTLEEVKLFIKYVNKRAKTMLLVETVEAVEIIDEILEIEGIDEALVGLNDLSIGYKKHFMFELLTDGTVERLCKKFKAKGIPYGFGGIASLGKGMLPAEYIIGEHFRLRSEYVILSRSFCNLKDMHDMNEINDTFKRGIKEIRDYEEYCANQNEDFFMKNKEIVCEKVKEIVGE